MQIHHARSARHLVEVLLAAWSQPRPDPFDFDLAVVPGAGFQRWLSQQLAVTGGEDGICAGVEFTSPAGLVRRVAGKDDPWRPERLVWSVQRLALASEGELAADPALEPLRRHLRASRESWTASRRIARMFDGYASHRPTMLRAWATGADTGPTGLPLAENTWQARLWRGLAADLGDPLQARERLLTRLREAAVDGLPQRVAMLAPPRLDRALVELLEALGSHHRVDLVQLTPTPSRRPLPAPDGLRRAEFRRPTGHPLNDSLAAVADETALLLPPSEGLGPEPAPDTLLGWLQHDLRHDAEPRPRPLAAGDRSVQVHLSHGPDRQVEVLREVLTSVLAADPGLEPRDVVVVTPDVELVAPLLGATFGGDAHPAHEFRVQLADRSVAQTNPLATLLLELLEVADSRFEATTLLELCTHPAIERRFGFGPDNRDRLVTLVGQSGVRWGLNAAQRGGFGLAGFPQNTWIAGLQRLLLGVTLSERDLVTAGTVLPLDDLDSSDLDLIGGLTELVGRLSRLVAEFSRPAPLAEWARRCRDGLGTLVRPARGEEWQLSDLVAGLARLAERDPSGTPLSRPAAARAIAEEFRGRPARGAFGNGALVVCGPGSLRHVPHRVVVLLGWDAERYPRLGRRPGDDLTGAEPLVGDPSPALDDRQALLDMLHCAGERLVVVARGRSGATNEEVPLAAPLTELLEALDLTATTADGTPVSRAVTVQHPLQPFAPEYFDPARPDLASADGISLRAALALRGTPAPMPERYAFEALPAPDLSGGVTLDEVTGFFSYPVRTLLRARAGLYLDGGPEDSDAIPIDPGGLERWQIGDRVLQRLRDGLDPLVVERAEWLRGSVPPFELGQSLLRSVVGDAREVAAALPPGRPEVHDLALTVAVPGHGRVPLVGRVAVHGREIVQGQASRLQARHRLVAWLRLLALAAAEPGPWRARVVGRDEAAGYLAPPQAEAAGLLGRYLGLYALGLSRPLPVPPRFGAAWAGFRLRGEDPRGSLARQQLETAWKLDTANDPSWRLLGFSFPSVLDLDPVGLPALPGADPSETSLVGALSGSIWQPPQAWGQST